MIVGCCFKDVDVFFCDFDVFLMLVGCLLSLFHTFDLCFSFIFGV